MNEDVISVITKEDEEKQRRFVTLQEQAKERTFDELFSKLKYDMNWGHPHSIFDSMFAVLLKFSYELEEIKQCLKPNNKPLTVKDVHPEYHQEEKDE